MRQGQRYYYRRRTVGGRKVRVYVGRGEVAEVAAALDELKRSRRRLEREELHQQQQATAQAEGLVEHLEKVAELLTHAALRAGGYHLHHRGEWRRRRRRRTVAIDQPPKTLTAKQLQDVLERAQQGDRTILPELERILDSQPEIWRRCGDLAGQVLSAWVRLTAGTNLLLEQSLRRQLVEMRQELEGGSANPLEQILVERIVACWLQAQQADAAAAQSQSNAPAVHALLLRRQESAQKRLLQATQRLATVRKLHRPTLSPVELAMRSGGDGRVGGRNKTGQGRLAELACG
jgi:hypothetical protein